MVLAVENRPADAVDIRDGSLIPGSGRSPGGEYGNPIPWMEEPAGLHTVHRVAKSQTQLKRLSMKYSGETPININRNACL